MMGVELQTIGSWVWILAGGCAVVAGMYGAVKWARKQLKDAIYDDIHPLLNEIGLSVNNVGPGEPKLIDRVKNTERLVIDVDIAVKKAEHMALEAATAARLAAAVAETTATRLHAHLTELGEN
jgi:hypothetical protein